MHVVVAVLCSLAAVFFIAGTATPFATFSLNGISIDAGLFRQCVTIAGTTLCASVEFSCNAFQSALVADRAFAVLSCLSGGACALLAVAAMFVDSLAGAADKCMMPGAAASFAFSLIAWAIGFALFTVGWCGGAAMSSVSGTSVGPLAPLILVGWLLSAGAIFALHRFRGEQPSTASTAAGYSHVRLHRPRASF